MLAVIRKVTIAIKIDFIRNLAISINDLKKMINHNNNASIGQEK
jgi:hypothetical protein